MMRGDQSGDDEEMLPRGTLEREGTKVMLQQLTIEEHQVRDLVTMLLQLFIHNAEGHIDLLVIQYMTNPRTTGKRRGVKIEGHRMTRNIS
jgi:hypothetical protein